jgi:O-antigen ligase
MTEPRGSGAPPPGAVPVVEKGPFPFTDSLDEAPETVYELRGTWAFVTWGSLITIALVPFTNVFLPGTHREYSVMSVTQLFFWACILLSPRVIKRGYSPILMGMVLLFGIRYVYGSLLSNFPEQMADSTRNMIRPMLWAWILAAVMRDGKIRRLGCDFFLLGCVVAGALHLNGIGADAAFGAKGIHRVSAFELNANVLGVIYATGFVMAVARVIQPRAGFGTFRRLLFAGAGAVCMAGLVMTGSRTAALFASLGSIILIAIEMRRARWSLTAIMAVLLVIGGAWGVFAADSVFGERSERVVTSGLASEDRARMAPVLVDQFLRSPIYGLGPENYRVELGERSHTGEPGVGIVAHNQLFMFAVEMGLFGLIPFLAICFLLLIEAWRVRVEDDGGLPIALALPCVLTACTVANIAFHWHFHFIVGLVAAAYGAHRAAMKDPAPSGGRP